MFTKRTSACGGAIDRFPRLSSPCGGDQRASLIAEPLPASTLLFMMHMGIQQWQGAWEPSWQAAWKPTWLSALFLVVGLVAIATLRKPRTAKQYLLSQLPDPHNFNWPLIEPKRFCPFIKTGPLTIGLERIDPHEWLLVDANADTVLARRREYLEKWGDGRLVIENDLAREAVCELWERATSFVVSKYPRMYVFNKGLFINKINGSSAPQNPDRLSSRQVLMHLSLMFEEDFILLSYDAEQNEYAVQAANHVHPTGFNPKDILGAALSTLHAPVPGYHERLRSPMARFFARLRGGVLMQRLNWSCQEGELLCLPSGDPAEVMQIKSRDGTGQRHLNPELMNVRVERQTLQRLPKSQFVLFTVRTYLYPLSDIKGRGLGGVLRRAVQSLDWHFGQYKGRQNWGDAVAKYLGSAA